MCSVVRAVAHVGAEHQHAVMRDVRVVGLRRGCATRLRSRLHAQQRRADFRHHVPNTGASVLESRASVLRCLVPKAWPKVQTHVSLRISFHTSRGTKETRRGRTLSQNNSSKHWSKCTTFAKHSTSGQPNYESQNVKQDSTLVFTSPNFET